LDGSGEKSESHSHTEKIHKLNKENTEKANPFLVQRNPPKSRDSSESKASAGWHHSNSWKGSLQKTPGKSPVEVNAKEANKSQNNPDAGGDDPELVKKHDGSQGSPRNVGEDDKRKDEKAGASAKTSQRKKSVAEADIKIIYIFSSRHKENEKVSFLLKDEQTTISKRHVNEKSFLKDVNKRSRVYVAKASGGFKPKEAAKPKTTEFALPGKTVGPKSAAANKNKMKPEASKGDNLIIGFGLSFLDNMPAMPAPFDHRIIKAKRAGIGSFYQIFLNEVLGGGRFGQVHRCEEKETGLKLAAKIIKARNVKEKDEVKNEINIMNQLTHMNIIQLYDAFESKNDVVLIMEYVEGGELFDRILDESSNLTEMDAILFIKQICEGIQFMHQMYILHLDLKVLCIYCTSYAKTNVYTRLDIF
ncbi:PREDICTED: serine/threonine-protein kinase DCLK3-like, partial [Thamnophis sirtalis]|uniref:Serine/threonine-protein kinase DCLK3-like n=1 Tax=Thamnophis sirtalis TaxID=35019 RepID=A0A6I9Z2W6_9SAUR